MSDRYLSRDAIERFLDRSWMLQTTPTRSLKAHRSALGMLDDWLHKHRVSTLTSASAADLRALLNSAQWDAASRRCAALLGLITRFYRSMQECHFRGDDPMDTLHELDLASAVRKRHARRSSASRREREREQQSELVFDRPRVV